MQFEPSGIVTLIKGIPFSSNYKDTRYFSSLQEQTNYFLNKPEKLVFENCSYTRQTEQYVAVDANIESLWEYNYLMFQNETMGNKWFYAFIDRYEYKAPSTTFVYFTVDVVQSWMFDAPFAQCFIEREHVGIQTVGQKFWAPENVEYGTDYVTVNQQFVDYVNTDTSGSAVLLTSTVDLSNEFGDFDNPNLIGADGGVVHRLPSGCDYYVVCPDVYGDASIYDVFNLMKQYPWVSKGIIGMTIVPLSMLQGMNIGLIGIGNGSFSIGRINGDSAPPTSTVYSGNIFTGFESVEQMKLLMYPYSFVEITLQNGQTLIVKPQYVNGTTLEVIRKSVLSIKPEVKYYLNGYTGLGDDYDFSLSMKDFPQCPVQDTSYLLSVSQTQQGTLMGLESSLISTGISGLVSLLTSNPVGLISSIGNALTGTQQALYKYNQADAQSPTLSGQIGGTYFNYATEKMGCTIRWKMISSGYRKIISDYWNKFGYQINEIKTPSPNKMSRFDYLKTLDCKLSGTIPQDDKVQLINIYDSGITFWHDDNIGDYSNNTGVQ